MGSDGIFDALSNEEVVETVWETVKEHRTKKDVHEICSLAVDNIIKHAISKETLDNVSVIILAFESFAKKIAEGAEMMGQGFTKMTLEDILKPKETSNGAASKKTKDMSDENANVGNIIGGKM